MLKSVSTAYFTLQFESSDSQNSEQNEQWTGIYITHKTKFKIDAYPGLA